MRSILHVHAGRILASRNPPCNVYFSTSSIGSSSPQESAKIKITSLGFSGAGFLGCYHLGVLQYLTDNYLLHPSQVLLGSSAGSLVSAATLLKCSPSSLMSVVNETASHARRAGPLTSLTPGVSLVDVMSPYMREAIEKSTGLQGEELSFYIKRHVNSHLRVHLTSPSLLGYLGDFRAHAYLDEFPTYSRLHAACILSSYVPLATGYMDRSKGVVGEATSELENVTAKRLDCRNEPEYTVVPPDNWVDGGLSVMWPTKDTETVVVSPVNIKHATNMVICPSPTEGSNWVRVSKEIEVEVSWGNARGGRDMIHPQTEKRYMEVYDGAYGDAERVGREMGWVVDGQ